MEKVDRLTTEIIDGSYQLVSVIAEGGNGVVYRATHTLMGRDVAIKFISGEASANSTELQRFQREIVTLGMLNHPNIAQTLGAGLHKERLYLVMELVEGISLRDLLAQEGKLSLERTIRIATDVVAALQHAHQSGVIHRDVKPGNIMLSTRNGVETAILMDFGIARLLPHSGRQIETITDSASVVGSPMYMSPEQGTKHEITARTDIYSLACVVFEMLFGQPPFCGSTAYDTMFKHLYEEAPRLDSLDPSIPHYVSDVVHRAMEKDPLDRFGSVSEFLSALSGQSNVGHRAVAARRSARLALISAAFLALASAIFLAMSSTSSTANRIESAQGDSLASAQFNYLHDNLEQCETICRRLLEACEKKSTHELIDSNKGELFGTLISCLNAQRKYKAQIEASKSLSARGFKDCTPDAYPYIVGGSIAGAEHLLGEDSAARNRLEALLPILARKEYKFFTYSKLGDTYLKSDHKKAQENYRLASTFVEGEPGTFWYDWMMIHIDMRLAVVEDDPVVRHKMIESIQNSILSLVVDHDSHGRVTLDLSYDFLNNLNRPEEAKMLQSLVTAYVDDVDEKRSSKSHLYKRFAD